MCEKIGEFYESFFICWSIFGLVFWGWMGGGSCWLNLFFREVLIFENFMEGDEFFGRFIDCGILW